MILGHEHKYWTLTLSKEGWVSKEDHLHPDKENNTNVRHLIPDQDTRIDKRAGSQNIKVTLAANLFSGIVFYFQIFFHCTRCNNT